MNSRSWWTCRTLLTQQRVLAERSSSLRSLLLTSSATMLTQFGSPEAVREHGWTQQLLAGEARVLAAAAQLEAGLIEHAYGHNETARQCFEHAENICGLELSLTGSLGFRTIYQVSFLSTTWCSEVETGHLVFCYISVFLFHFCFSFLCFPVLLMVQNLPSTG
jgi:hypothetical protein